MTEFQKLYKVAKKNSFTVKLTDVAFDFALDIERRSLEHGDG